MLPRIQPLINITEPLLRAELITYATSPAGAAFTPTATEVSKLNAIVATLPSNTPTAQPWDDAINTAFTGNANPPTNNLITAGGNLANINTQHARLRPLYAIGEPTLRQALIEFAKSALGVNFQPTDAEVLGLSAALNALGGGPLTTAQLGGAVRGAFNVAHNPPPATYFDAAGIFGLIPAGPGNVHFANINADHTVLQPLYANLNNVTEPFLRATLMTFAVANHGFNPQPADITKLNDDIAALPANATVADFARVVNGAFPANGPALNYFDPTHAGEFAVISIAAEHKRLAPLYKIDEPALRAAMLAYAKENPAFSPLPSHITALNDGVAAIPRVATAALYDTALQTAFAGLAVYPGFGPVAYFAVGGAGNAAFAALGIAAEHNDIYALNSVAEPALRKALIDYAKAQAVLGANFQPTPANVDQLNADVAGLIPGVNAAALDFDNALRTAFGAVANAPANYFVPGAPGAATFNSIDADHTRLAPLYKITEPALRKALVAYAAANTDFNPTGPQVENLNDRVAILRNVTDNNLGDAVNAAFTTATNPPLNVYFTAGHPGAAAFIALGIAAEHTRLAPLYKINEPALRAALLAYAGPVNFQPTNEQVLTLNTAVAALTRNPPGPAAAAADFDGAVQAAFAGGVNPPGINYFAGLAPATFNPITNEHDRIASLGSINEPALRKALIDYAKATPAFGNIQTQAIDKLNALVANLGPAATAADYDRAVQNAFQGGGAVSFPPTPYFAAVAAPGVPGPAAFTDLGIAAEHTRLAPLYKIDSPALRKALIDFATINPPPLDFQPTDAQVARLNNLVTDLPGLRPGIGAPVLVTAAQLDGAVNAAFNGGINPPVNYFTNAAPGAPGPAAVAGIAAQHADTVALYKVTEPELRKALIDYAIAHPGFSPAYEDILVLNAAVASLPTDANADVFSATVHQAFAAVLHGPGPMNNHFKAGGAGQAAFARITAQHEQIAPLLAITEPALRQALVNYAAANYPAFTPTDAQVRNLNDLIERLPPGPPYPTNADYDREVTNAFGVAHPGATYFQTNPVGQVAFAKIDADHQIIQPLHAVKETALRQTLIDYATKPHSTFQPQAGDVANLNTAIAALKPPAQVDVDAATYGAAVNAAFPGRNPPPANHFVANVGGIDGIAAFKQIKGDHAYTTIMTDLATKNAAGPTAGAYTHLIGHLTNPENKAKVVKAMSALPNGQNRRGLVWKLSEARSETQAKSAMKKLGLDTSAASDAVIKDIVIENKDREVVKVKGDATPFVGTSPADTDKKIKDIKNTHYRFEEFKKLLDSFYDETSKAASGQSDIQRIREKAETIHALKIKLLNYRNTLENIKTPPIHANNPLRGTVTVARATKLVTEIDKYLGPYIAPGAAVPPPPPVVPGAPVPPPAGLIPHIEWNVKGIMANQAPEGGAKKLGYYTTRITTGAAHTVPATGNTKDDYDTAVGEVQTHLGLAVGPSPAARMRAAPGGSDYQSTDDAETSWVAINVEAKTKVIRGQDVKMATAIVRQKSATSATQELFAAGDKWQQLANVHREYGMVDFRPTSVPGRAVMQWAAAVVNSFMAIKPANETIQIETFTLPKELSEALILYCKHKGFAYEAYYPIEDNVSDAQVKLFAKKWEKVDRKDVGVQQEQELTKNTAKFGL